MNIEGKPYRTIWVKKDDKGIIQVIDQRFLPHRLVIQDLKKPADFLFAIREMQVRGAPLIGVAAAYGIYSALINAGNAESDTVVLNAYRMLLDARPTASNLKWALEHTLKAISRGKSRTEKIRMAFRVANALAEEDVRTCRAMGLHGLPLIEKLSRRKEGEPVNILTHCNAGWLATVDYGTATAPIYLAQEKGIKVHVWVDETRPRNQGANLTAYELGQQGIPHTVIADNAGGHLMQRGMVDMCIVGTDRTTIKGDVCNKVGTYLKALAAKESGIPFYVALPSSSLDWQTKDASSIPIEQRDPDEVRYVSGWDGRKIRQVRITPQSSAAANYAFDVTPARFITALITEKGVCAPSEQALKRMFSKHGK
jgi:methylthioribose-1-phosphate isomerase